MSDERYQQRQQKVKDRVDARVAQAQEERGIIIVFTGNGKGKTTAAFGTAARAVGHGKNVGVVQFIKGTWPNGERNLLEPHGVEFQVMATGFTWETQNREADTAACMAVWQHGKRRRLRRHPAQTLLSDDSRPINHGRDYPLLLRPPERRPPAIWLWRFTARRIWFAFIRRRSFSTATFDEVSGGSSTRPRR